MKKGPSAAQVAAAHLRATDNPSVSSGDVHLCHEIAEKYGMTPNGPPTVRRIMDAIERSNDGDLYRGDSFERGRRRCRCFWLPENAPACLRDVVVEGHWV